MYRKKSITVVLILLVTAFGWAQCKVQGNNLQGEYIGDCKKGKAHGEGSVTGIDSYKGLFSKGYPNGEGVYTWGNGNVYTGSFKKGKKDGKGSLKIKESGKEIMGYWKSDDYIGLEKNPYKVLQRPASVTSTSFQRKVGSNEFIISFLKGGKVLNNKRLDLISLEGNYGNVISNKIKFTVQNVIFPYTGKMNIDGQELRFRITQAGSWTIKLNIR